MRQAKLFRQSSGLARFVWNWGLAICQRHYRMFGGKLGYLHPGDFGLVKLWNRIKHIKFKWALSLSQRIAMQAIRQLHHAYMAAYKRFKKAEESGKPINRKKAGFPKFKKKSKFSTFAATIGPSRGVRISGNRVSIPKAGMVRVETPIRWPNTKQVISNIKERAGRWWLMITFDVSAEPISATEIDSKPSCGIDIGSATFLTISSAGEIVSEVQHPKPYAKAKRRIKMLNRRMRRRNPESNRRQKAKKALSRLHEKVTNTRHTFIHQQTAKIIRTYGSITIEDLNAAGLISGMFSHFMGDIGIAEFRRQLVYKSEMRGARIKVADRFYPSSKTCSGCGFVDKKLTVGDRVFRCNCGLVINRDHNAAINLESIGKNLPEFTRGESGSSSLSSNGKRGAARQTANATEPLAQLQSSK